MKLDRLKVINGRLAQGWTQEQAAEEAGVSRPTFKSAEKGEEILPPSAKKIADALGLSLGEIMIPVTDTPEAANV